MIVNFFYKPVSQRIYSGVQIYSGGTCMLADLFWVSYNLSEYAINPGIASLYICTSYLQTTLVALYLVQLTSLFEPGYEATYSWW